MLFKNHKDLYILATLLYSMIICLGQMQAEFQVMSPLVPIKQKKFLRYCKQHGDGLWAVVDVSYDINRENEYLKSYGCSKKFPSGCIIQDIGNGCSKVTCQFFMSWICVSFF